jgi:hypothetical protein
MICHKALKVIGTCCLKNTLDCERVRGHVLQFVNVNAVLRGETTQKIDGRNSQFKINVAR